MQEMRLCQKIWIKKGSSALIIAELLLMIYRVLKILVSAVIDKTVVGNNDHIIRVSKIKICCQFGNQCSNAIIYDNPYDICPSYVCLHLAANSRLNFTANMI